MKHRDGCPLGDNPTTMNVKCTCMRNGWRPMESAPMDGRGNLGPRISLLVEVDGGREVWTGYFSPRFDLWFDDNDERIVVTILAWQFLPPTEV